MNRKHWSAALFGASAIGLCAAPSLAEVARFEIVSVEHNVFGGQSFGAVGTYDRIKAKATIAVDPNDRRNAPIADIKAAPRNAAGKVEAVADVEIVTPSNPAKGAHRIFYEVVNRGHKLGLGLFNDAVGVSPNLGKASDAGNGYLMRQGYTLVWTGWQGDFEPRPDDIVIKVPVVPNVTGRVTEEFLFDNLTSPIKAQLTYPAADMTSGRLVVRARFNDAPATPADMSFRFIDPTHIEITRPKGFDAGALYQLEYTAKDPKVLSLGFAAMRDIVSFLRHDGSADNPLAAGGKPTIQTALAYGTSQSGRFLREYLYLGFNEDMSGKPVFEGMLPHVGGGRYTGINMRFGLPDRNPRHANDPAAIADRFPMSYAETTEPFTGVKDSLLSACSKTGTCPKIIQADSEYEWWGSRASLVITDPAGKPVKLPDNVRIVMTAGAPHGSGVNAVARTTDQCMLPLNPVAQGPTLRAVAANLDAWVVKGVTPPPSRTPNLEDGSLVDARTQSLSIPGLPYTGMHVAAASEDWTVLPHVIRGDYVVYVPKVNADGNILGGIHLPVHAVPKATYTGWNPHVVGDAPTTLCALRGGVLPFAATREERLKTGDPRLSVAERYPTAAAYVAKVDATARQLVKARYMLAEDLPRQHAAAAADTLSRLHPDPGAPPPRGDGD